MKTHLKTYINSFKNKTLLIVIPINIIFTLITILIIRLTQILSEPQINKISGIDLSNLVSQTEAQLKIAEAALKGFALFAISTAIIFLLILIINWSTTQGVVYSKLLKKKITLNYLNKFLLLNTLWFIPWILILGLVLFGGRAENPLVPAFIIILLFLHFSLILNTLFTKKPKLNQIKASLKLGTAKIHHFLLPYIIITVTFIIISQLNLLSINPIIIALIYILFFSWVQNYLKDITLKLISKTN